MKETVATVTDYRDRLKEIIQRDFPYLIMGFIVVISAGTFIYFQLSPVRGLNILHLSSDNDILNTQELQKSQDVAGVIEQQKINYISDKKITAQPLNESTSSLSRPEETGQISAISSDKVTYAGKKYTVKEGDSLAYIAEQTYGDRNAWVRIAEANNLLNNPDAISAGMVLVIPR